MSTLRLWRLKKLHQSVEAELHPTNERAEVRYLYNGALAYSRQCATRADAVADAAAKRAELERDGWMFHW